MSELSYADKRKLLAELLEKKNRARKTAPLSFAQERLFFLDQMQPNSALYNLPVSFRLQTGMNVEALERSLSEIVRRHEVLRTTFEQVEGSPVQVIHPPARLKLEINDLTQSPERENEALRLAAIEAQEPFNLRNGPLFRARLLRLQDQDHVLLLTMHHIVSDGWSMLVMVRELGTLYESYSRGTTASLPEPLQYADFARWQRQALTAEVIEKHLEYWRKQLAGAPPIIQLPFDRPRPPVQSFRGDMQHFTFGRGIAKQLLRLGEQEGATFFMTLLAAFQVLLARCSGQWDVVVGTPIANRNRTELEGMIGFFVNTLVLRTTMEDDPTFVDLLRRVKQTTVDAYAHQDLPFEKLVEQLQPERELSHNPLFQVMFATDLRTDAMRPSSSRAAGPPSLLMQTNTGTSKFDLALNMSESQAGLVGILEYNTDLFDAATMQRLIGIWEALLQSIAGNPGERVSKLNILTTEERRRLISLWNGAAVQSEPGNTSSYVLDAHLNPVPIGVTGELYVGGNKPVDGDLDNPLLTASRFLPDPFSETAGARMFRTGDLARYRADGVMEILGSIDRHVKIRGMRINLQEIETVLRKFPGVRDAVATYQENALRLGAYLVADVSSRSSPKVLRRYVADALPAYMRPAVFAWVDELPLDSFGAIDHKALPAFPAEEEPSFVAPASALEKVMAGIWSELTGVETVGRDDSFFELGGHSLLGTQLCSRLLDIFDIMIPIQLLFEKPVLGDFCSVVLDESSDRGRTEKIAELMLTVAEIPDAEITA